MKILSNIFAPRKVVGMECYLVSRDPTHTSVTCDIHRERDDKQETPSCDAHSWGLDLRSPAAILLLNGFHAVVGEMGIDPLTPVPS